MRVLTIALVVVITAAALGFVTDRISAELAVGVAAALFFQLVFWLLRFVSWNVVFRVVGVTLSGSRLLKALFISVPVDLTVFPGGVSGDFFKTFFLREVPVGKTATAIILYRVQAGLACFSVLFISVSTLTAGLGFYESVLLCIVGVAALNLLAGIRLRSSVLLGIEFVGVWLLALGCIFMDVLRAVSLFIGFGLIPGERLLASVAFARAGGAVLSLPNGIGPIDAVFVAFLHEQAGWLDSGYFVLLFHATGLGISALFGVLLGTEEIWNAVKLWSRRRERPRVFSIGKFVQGIRGAFQRIESEMREQEQ